MGLTPQAGPSHPAKVGLECDRDPKSVAMCQQRACERKPEIGPLNLTPLPHSHGAQPHIYASGGDRCWHVGACPLRLVGDVLLLGHLDLEAGTIECPHSEGG